MEACNRSDPYFVVFFDYDRKLQTVGSTKAQFTTTNVLDTEVTVKFKTAVIEDDGREGTAEMPYLGKVVFSGSSASCREYHKMVENDKEMTNVFQSSDVPLQDIVDKLCSLAANKRKKGGKRGASGKLKEILAEEHSSNKMRKKTVKESVKESAEKSFANTGSALEMKNRVKKDNILTVKESVKESAENSSANTGSALEMKNRVKKDNILTVKESVKESAEKSSANTGSALEMKNRVKKDNILTVKESVKESAEKSSANSGSALEMKNRVKKQNILTVKESVKESAEKSSANTGSALEMKNSVKKDNILTSLKLKEINAFAGFVGSPKKCVNGTEVSSPQKRNITVDKPETTSKDENLIRRAGISSPKSCNESQRSISQVPKVLKSGMLSLLQCDLSDDELSELKRASEETDFGGWEYGYNYHEPRDQQLTSQENSDNRISGELTRLIEYFQQLNDQQKRGVTGFISVLNNALEACSCDSSKTCNSSEQCLFASPLGPTSSQESAYTSPLTSTCRRNLNVLPEYEKKVPLIVDKQDDKRFQDVLVNPVSLRKAEQCALINKTPGLYLVNKVASLLFTNEEFYNAKGVSGLNSMKQEALLEYLRAKEKSMGIPPVTHNFYRRTLQNKITNSRKEQKKTLVKLTTRDLQN